ncbi:MAG: response regulator transcription factor [Hyphomicrobium sp.]|nr:response regulator transcription factor [Hyphomicrobium sp.]
MRILLIEDDRDTATYVTKGLEQEGHTVDRCADGNDGIVQIVSEPYDVAILDRMLPGIDGLSIVRRARSAGIHMPVLFLTALGGIDDRVDGLDAGGDDYLIKPFAFSELLARLNALTRRPQLVGEETKLKIADLELNLISRRVVRAGTDIDLQPREFRLLEVLMRNRGRVLTKTMLLERVWNFHFDPRTSVVETHISRLRTKIDKPFNGDLIRTVRGCGYSINDAP